MFCFLNDTRDELTWYININRYNSVTSPEHRVGIVVVASTVSTASHRDHPLRMHHLVVYLQHTNMAHQQNERWDLQDLIYVGIKPFLIFCIKLNITKQRTTILNLLC